MIPPGNIAPAPGTDAVPIRTVTLKDGCTVTLRRPVLDDAPAMLDYLDQLLREAPFLLLSSQDKLPTLEQEQAFITGHERPGALLLLAVAPDNLIVAVCTLASGKLCKSRHCAELGISMRAGWRSQGLGRCLMDELLHFARAHPDIHKVFLTVFADNHPAVRLYEQCGFVHEGRRVRQLRQPDGSYHDELLMGLWVKPEP